MSKIKIEDLPILEELDEKQSKGIFGGALMEPTISRRTIQTSTIWGTGGTTFDDPLLQPKTFDDPLLKPKSFDDPLLKPRSFDDPLF